MPPDECRRSGGSAALKLWKIGMNANVIESAWVTSIQSQGRNSFSVAKKHKAEHPWDRNMEYAEVQLHDLKSNSHCGMVGSTAIVPARWKSMTKSWRGWVFRQAFP